MDDGVSGGFFYDEGTKVDFLESFEISEMFDKLVLLNFTVLYLF